MGLDWWRGEGNRCTQEEKPCTGSCSPMKGNPTTQWPYGKQFNLLKCSFASSYLCLLHTPSSIDLLSTNQNLSLDQTLVTRETSKEWTRSHCLQLCARDAYNALDRQFNTTD